MKAIVLLVFLGGFVAGIITILSMLYLLLRLYATGEAKSKRVG